MASEGISDLFILDTYFSFHEGVNIKDDEIVTWIKKSYDSFLISDELKQRKDFNYNVSTGNSKVIFNAYYDDIKNVYELDVVVAKKYRSQSAIFDIDEFEKKRYLKNLEKPNG